MSREHIPNELRLWYERSSDGEAGECKSQPPFHELVAWIDGRGELSAHDAGHIESCSRCQRAVAAIRRELTDMELITAICESPEKGVVFAEPESTPLFSFPDWAVQRVRRLGGYAAAACVLIALAWFWSQTGGGRVQAFDLREVGFAKPISFGFASSIAIRGSSLDFNDPAGVLEAEETIEIARADRDADLDSGEDAWFPWTQLYRHQAALGHWDAALAEMEAFLAYSHRRDQTPGRYTMYYTALWDLGDAYAELGDYETAVDYHRQSYDVARDSTFWRYSPKQLTDDRPHGLSASMAATLAPRLERLGTLALVMGDRDAAWSSHRRAGELLLVSSQGECEYRGLPISGLASPADDVEPEPAGLDAAPGEGSQAAKPPRRDGPRRDGPHGAKPRGADAPSDSIDSLFANCRAVADAVGAEADGALHSLFTKAREHFYFRAVLLRVDRDLDEAARMLDLSESLPIYAFSEDTRLDFLVPTERARIAIARGRYDDAIAHADEAAASAGPRYFVGGRPGHPPIGVIARAELTFLRGVAMAGKSENDPDALEESLALIESAINAVQESARSLPQTLRAPFWDRLSNWVVIKAELSRRRESSTLEQ